jgi:hypothetical protein
VPGKSDVTENDILKLYFNATPIAGIADNAASGALANLFMALLTADPTDAGTALTNETAYTGYARKSIARGGAGFVVTGNSVSPAANQTFGLCTASPGGNITHAAYVDTASGAGRVFWFGPLVTPIVMNVGVTPQILATSTVTED